VNDQSEIVPDTAAIPDGFVRLEELVGFVEHAGPLYWRPERSAFALGFRVTPQHMNVGGVVHGGMLTTAADMALALGFRSACEVEAFLPTIHLDVDFYAPAKLGDWVEFTFPTARRVGRTGFATVIGRVGEVEIMRGSGVMKIPRDDDPRFKPLLKDPIRKLKN
jgi:acyl-coenzyme A thioesterase PaaI-like protein